ncbi:MAG: hypothetical protein FVQ82_05415 [Planctomycetes bacterium]|nr:hypothetical protein [Planctomycetota bacterium]
MKVRVFVIVCLLMFSVCVFADEVLLSNSKALFPAERVKNRRYSFPLLAARLSPSGKYLIYPKMVPASPPDYITGFKLMIYEVATGKEKSVDLNLSSGIKHVCTQFNLFNPAGDKLVLLRYSYIEKKRQGEVVVYDIKKEKLTSTGIKGDNILGVFDNTGENIFVMQSETSFSKVTLSDLSIKPTSFIGFCQSHSPYSPYSAMYIVNQALESGVSFELWNTKTEKKIGDLPLHFKNGVPDDVQGQWTADGKYVFYLDVLENTREKFSPVTRVWDVVSNKQIAELPDAMPVGVGPTKTSVVMVGIDRMGIKQGMYVYDVKSKEFMDIGLKDAKAVHSCGSKLLYMLKKDGEDMVYVADMSIVK